MAEGVNRNGWWKGFNPAKHVKGRKRHLMTDTLGLVRFVVVCAACIADSDGAFLGAVYSVSSPNNAARASAWGFSSARSAAR